MRRLRARRLRILLLLPALAVAAAGIQAPLHGSHAFRQAHVAANIEKFVSKGLSLRPETYNVDAPLSVYDFPAYQLLVAAVCRVFGTDPLSSARTVSVLCFGLTLCLLGALLERTGVGALQATLALVFFAYAPLVLFYFQAPMVDVLALLLSYLSLYAFVRWDLGSGRSWLLLSILGGMASTLIKNPVYVPVLVAVLWYRLRRRGWRSLAEPGIVGLVAAVGATVLLFKVYANAVNGTPALLARWEAEQYFGPPEERLDPGAWALILATLGQSVLSPLAIVASAAGLRIHLHKGAGGGRTLYTGLLLGSLLALLVFFNRYRDHNYYELPLVFPLAFLAAAAVWRALAWLRAAARGRRTRARAWSLAALGVVMAVTLASSRAGFQEMSESGHWMESRGEWIRARTSPDDFVVYVLGAREGHWNPAYLYFAKRDGCNVARTQVDRETLARLSARYAAPHRRFFVFDPDPGTAPALRRLGAEPVAAGKSRHLYRVDPSRLAAEHPSRRPGPPPPPGRGRPAKA